MATATGEDVVVAGGGDAMEGEGEEVAAEEGETRGMLRLCEAQCRLPPRDEPLLQRREAARSSSSSGSVSRCCSSTHRQREGEQQGLPGASTAAAR